MTAPTLYEYAIAYADLGLFPIPIKANGKEAVKKWGGVNTPEEALARFPAHHAGNIAISFPDLFFVVDVDCKNGSKGFETLADLEAKHGPLPSTWEATTPSGGKHLVFRSPVPVGNATNKLPGIDIKTAGGYVVCEPSHIGGKSYGWLDWEIGELPSVADAPQWLVSLLTSGRNATQSTPERTAPAPGQYVTPEQQAELRDALTYLDADPYGEWISVGIDLCSLGNIGFALWDEWSATSDKYDHQECVKKWRGFTASRTGYAAVFAKAQRAGWINPLSKNAPRVSEDEAPATPPPKHYTQSRGAAFPAPFPGAMADVVKHGLETAHKAQPDLTLVAALVGMAASINGHFCMPDGQRLNLYALAVSETGTGKNTHGRISEEIAATAGASIFGKPASGAGIEDAMNTDFGNALCSIDEIGFLAQSFSDAKAPQHIKSIEEALLRLFSVSASKLHRRIKALVKGAMPELSSTAHPCLSLLGFTTPSGLGDGLTPASIEGGLLGRCLFVAGDPEAKLSDTETPFTLPELMRDTAQAIRTAWTQQGSLAGIVIQHGKGSREASKVLRHTFEGERLASRENEPEAAALLARSFEKASRIAGVLAVWSNPTAPTLLPEHWQWAEALSGQAMRHYWLLHITGFMRETPSAMRPT